MSVENPTSHDLTTDQTSMKLADSDTEIKLSEIARLLSRHFGDGVVYVRSASQQPLYDHAVQAGYISREGYLTRRGRLLVARYRRA